MIVFRYFVFISAMLCMTHHAVAKHHATSKSRVTLFTVSPLTHAGTVYHAKAELQKLGYGIQTVDTIWDMSAKHSLIAFQKIDSLPRTGTLARDVMKALDTATRVKARESGRRHIEVDLDRQVLFVVDSAGFVERVLPVSSGSGQHFKVKRKVVLARTPTGKFKVQRKLEGMHQSPLGLLFYPMFFDGGFAIHGENSVPTTAASHGCVRIPNYAAIDLWNTTPVGTPVFVYGENPELLDKK